MLVYFSGDWDVHWGYDLDFDPYPNCWLIGRLHAGGEGNMEAQPPASMAQRFV